MKIPEHIREYFRKQGSMGAAERNANLSAEKRREIARKAAQARWGGRTRKDKGAK